MGLDAGNSAELLPQAYVSPPNLQKYATTLNAHFGRQGVPKTFSPSNARVSAETFGFEEICFWLPWHVLFKLKIRVVYCKLTCNHSMDPKNPRRHASNAKTKGIWFLTI